VSVGTGGEQGVFVSWWPSISGDGQHVVFTYLADTFAAGATENGKRNFFVHDLSTGNTELIGQTILLAFGDSDSPVSIAPSDDGRYVVFESDVTTLVTGDTNGFVDVFVYDWAAATTERVSVAGRSQRPSVSENGRFVAFASTAENLVPGDTNGVEDVFVYDRRTGETKRVSVDSAGAQSDGTSTWPSISSDGRFVAFASGAGNLVADDTNGRWDVFVHNRQSGVTERVSLADDEAEGDMNSGAPSISADGLRVAFDSGASNLVIGDTNGQGDVFVRDRQLGTTARVSVSTGGMQGDGESFFSTISAEGNHVAFESRATNLTAGDANGADDVFVRDIVDATTERVSVDSNGAEGNSTSFGASISADGHFVAFMSDADNLVPGDGNACQDVFVRDRTTGETEQVSVDSNGVPGNRSSVRPSISADGRYIAFVSGADNLVPTDVNGRTDVFVHDRWKRVTELISLATDGSQALGGFLSLAISPDGRWVAFESDAANLVPGDTNGMWDIFLRFR
jgi:Tol biopolymer transport system component